MSDHFHHFEFNFVILVIAVNLEFQNTMMLLVVNQKYYKTIYCVLYLIIFLIYKLIWLYLLLSFQPVVLLFSFSFNHCSISSNVYVIYWRSLPSSNQVFEFVPCFSLVGGMSASDKVINPSLFTTADGRQLCFSLTPCPKRAAIQPLVEVLL